jgi:predicted NUDIX family NTP pyrophosphohydrolase
MLKSAGLLPFRQLHGYLEVLLVHPGGPFWAKKDHGAWSIAKGEFKDDEDPLQAAKREFTEETGVVPTGELIPLQPVRQPSGKVVYVWGLDEDVVPDVSKSNMFSIEWPPKSGRRQDFPEVDRAAWFSLEEAKKKILKGQLPLLHELEQLLAVGFRDSQHDR